MPGYIRALGVLVLLAGVAVMHAVVFGSGHAQAAGHAQTVGHAQAAEPMAAEGPGAVLMHTSGYAGRPPAAVHSGHSATRPWDARMPADIRSSIGHSAGASHSAALAPSAANADSWGGPGLPGDSAAAHRADSVASVPARADTGANCEGCGGTHGGMHACVFVLAALVLALGLAVLAWVGFGGRDTGRQATSRQAFRRARPPPWTVLSLSELAILRI
ncbi:DUF6153 family protein [Nocardia mexicana]|nr:DUF6153 family protein [Nocardia mexicana]